MAEKLLMLALSPTMDKGIIAEWLKKEGDAVASGDVLCEVETDKTAMDYESSADGVLLKIVLPEGSEAAVGDLIGIIGEEGEDISDLLTEAAEKEQTEIESSEPETAEQPDEAADSASEEKEEKEDQSKSDADTKATDDKNRETEDSSGLIKASPLARKLAEKHGLNLSEIKGSGPAGRIIKADIEKAADKKKDVKASADDDSSPAAKQPDLAQSAQEDIVIPVSGKRKVIAQRLSESKYSAPHYYLKLSVEMDGLIEARSQFNQKSESKISMNAFFLKFIAEALKKHARVNASWNGDTMTLHGSIDIGIAVAQEDGLITPVVRNCGHKGMIQIDNELKELVKKARSNTLKPDEYNGATFTISNLGSYGIEDFTAIINPPGAAILAIGAIKKEPVVQPDDSLAIRSVMKLSLSCDHRVIDGAVGAVFLTELKEMMESPVKALF